MKITDVFRNIFRPRHSFLASSFTNFGDWFEHRMNFANLIFLNICDILSDLVNDTTLTLKGGDAVLFAEFKYLFENYGQLIINKLFSDGFVVIGYNAVGFRVLRADEYTTTPAGSWQKIIALSGEQVYVLKSNTFEQFQISDRTMLIPFLTYLDNVMNSSNTVTSRLGALVAATPTQPAQNPATELLRPEQRDQIEKEVQSGYGSLRGQKQFLLFNRPMDLRVISLAGTDGKTLEKMKLAILAIADRIKVPANQIAIIDALSSKSLSNGSELREGDFMKYQSFERLVNQVFINFASALGLRIDYTIYNKPIRTAAGVLTASGAQPEQI